MVAALINPQVKPDQTASTGKATPLDPQNNAANPAVGAGVTGASSTTSVPPVAGAPGDPTVNVDLGAALASLLKFLPLHDDAEVSCARAMCKVSDMQMKDDRKQIEVDFNKQKEQMAAKLKAAKDMEEQLKSVSGSGFWDVIKIVCAVVVSVLAIVASGGAAGLLLVALLASGICGLIGAADEILQTTTGHGIAGNVCMHLCGGSEEDAKKADMVFGIVLGVVQLVAGIVALCVGNPNTAMSGWARLSLAIGGAAASVGAAVVYYENSGHQAAALRARAREELAQSALDQLDASVKRAMASMTTNLGNFGRTRDDLMDELADRGRQAIRVRFA
jgi:hypothetical protein